MTSSRVLNGHGYGEQFSEGFVKSEEFRAGVEQIVAEHFRSGNAETTRGIPETSVRSNRYVGAITPISDIRGADTLCYRKSEKQMRCKLASCCRLANIYGWDSGLLFSLSARLAKASDQFLINPYGILCDEVTAAHLVKVDARGHVLDEGCTGLGVSADLVALHGAIYGARSDINCIFFVSNPSAISVSALKCGLLPLCHEAMSVGEISYSDYAGSLADADNSRQLLESFGNTSKVLFIRNFGVVISGETVEETFHIASNIMTAVETQISLLPIGLNNIHLPSSDTQKSASRTEHQLPPGVNVANKWCYGEVEFEALMRQLDNAGYSTGYVYRASSSRQQNLRSQSTTDVPTSPLSFLGDERDIANLSQVLAQKRTARPELSVSPNVYQREETTSGRNTPLQKTVTKWVSGTNSVGLSKPRSSSVRATSSNRFAPQGSNPRELKEKVREIRKEYFQDTITAGPQSTVLEGLTWEEARRIKAGQTAGGVDDVRISAASRGVIQRDHQPKALFYKNFQLGNPFENVTDRDLEQYKKEVEKKSKKGPDTWLSDSEMDRRYDYKDTSYDQGRKSVDSELYLRDSKPSPVVPSVRAPVIETNIDDVSPPVVPVTKPILIPQPQQKIIPPPPETKAPEPPVQKQQQHLELQQPKEIVSESELQRHQSARFPEKAPQQKKEKLWKSGSLRLSKKSAPTHDMLLDVAPGHAATMDNRSSKENSPAREGSPSKDKKKKRGFRLPSFSKKKEKQ